MSNLKGMNYLKKRGLNLFSRQRNLNIMSVVELKFIMMKQQMIIPESIKLFEKYLRNELTDEERIQFDRNVSYTQAEDKISRKVKMLETIFPNETHRIERLVRDNSEEYINFLEKFGLLGYRLDNIIVFLANFQSATKNEITKTTNWNIAEEVFNLRN
jgi:hypothetical protein